MVKIYASFLSDVTMQTIRRKVFILFIMKNKNDGKVKTVILKRNSNVGKKTFQC